MKKVLLVFLSALFIVSAFAGCGDNTSENNPTQASSENTSDLETMETREPLTSEMQAIADALEVKEYRCTGLDYEHIVFVVTNNSKTDCALNVAVNFYDKSKKLVDTQQDDLEAIGAGQTSVLAVYANEKFESYTYDFTPSELSYYTAVTKDLELKVKEGESKLIASVTNKGKAKAYFTTVNTLFFKGDKLDYYEYNYVGDDDSIIAPGKTETKEFFTNGDYDRYENYLNSYGKAEE